MLISTDGAILSFFMNIRRKACLIPYPQTVQHLAILYQQTVQHLCYSLSTDCATPCYSLSTDSATLMLFLISRLCNTLLFLINRRRNTCVIPYQQTVKHLWYSLSTDVPSLVLFNRRCNSESRSSFLVNSVEINVPSVENLDMTNILPLQPGVSLIIDTHASPISRNVFFVLISTSRDGPFTFISSKLFFSLCGPTE